MDMKIKIVILDLAPWRRMLLRFALPLALVAVASGVGIAAVPHVFNKGDVISAGAMNENFMDLEKKTQRTVGTVGSVAYSIGFTQSCGATPPTNGGFGGYAVGKARCQAAC